MHRGLNRTGHDLPEGCNVGYLRLKFISWPLLSNVCTNCCHVSASTNAQSTSYRIAVCPVN